MRRALSGLLLVGALAIVPGVASAQQPVPGPAALAAADSVVSSAELPKPFAAFSRSALGIRDSIVALARAQIGRRYVLGGESPKRGFDCSGLVRYIVAALHISLPRTAAQQARVGERIPTDTSRLLPGDLLTFGRGKRISHIAIYVGNGKMIHASTKAGRVIETDLLRPPARGIKPWRGARRLVLDDSGAAAARADSAN